MGDNVSTVEVAQYSGDKDLKYYEFSKNLEIFSRTYFASKSDRPHHRPQLLTMADMVKDLGYKNLVLGCSVHQGITSVLWRDSFSAVGDSFSIVEVAQYSGDSFSTVGG